ncbi:MAG: biopolymer transporter [Rhodobacter sp. CACIA14H1]|nr:MAG: biopolymer transporter [Rhodobacter sp. CACIA14H1]
MSVRLDGDDEDVAAEINVTPFIDVMLVLLIVFMVAAPLSTVDVPVTLPSSAAAGQPRPEEPVFVTVTAEGGWSVGEVAVAPGALGPALDAATGGDRTRAVLVRGDAEMRYQDMVRLLDALRGAGYTTVALVAQEEAGGTE